jgi:cysteine synthase A
MCRTLSEPGHRIQGGGYAMPSLPLLDATLIDGFVQVSDAEAIDGARRLAKLEGIFARFSSGACVRAAERLLTGEHAGKTCVIGMADSGMKYLSTDLWSEC